MNDRQARLAAVLDLWVVLGGFTPYLEDQHIDLDSTLGPALQDAATADTSDMQRHALSRLTLALHDDHARVLSSRHRRWTLAGTFPLLETAFIVTANPAAGQQYPESDRPSFPSMDSGPRSETSFRGPDVRGDASVCPAPLDIRHRIREERNDRNAGRPRAWQCA